LDHLKVRTLHPNVGRVVRILGSLRWLMTLALHSRPILIVYGAIDLFVVELQDALDRAGAQSVIARTRAVALRQLQRFDFDAVVINHVANLDDEIDILVDALDGSRRWPSAARGRPFHCCGCPT
jgi:hypothetical protein